MAKRVEFRGYAYINDNKDDVEDDLLNAIEEIQGTNKIDSIEISVVDIEDMDEYDYEEGEY